MTNEAPATLKRKREGADAPPARGGRSCQGQRATAPPTASRRLADGRDAAPTAGPTAPEAGVLAQATVAGDVEAARLSKREVQGAPLLAVRAALAPRSKAVAIGVAAPAGPDARGEAKAPKRVRHGVAADDVATPGLVHAFAPRGPCLTPGRVTRKEEVKEASREGARAAVAHGPRPPGLGSL